MPRALLPSEGQRCFSPPEKAGQAPSPLRSAFGTFRSSGRCSEQGGGSDLRSSPDLLPHLVHLPTKSADIAPTPSGCYPRGMCRNRHLAHSAHLRATRSTSNAAPPTLCHTWAPPRCPFPESLVELRPLLHRVTPALSVFPLKNDAPSRHFILEGAREAPALTIPSTPNTSPAIPWKHQPLASILFFQGKMDQGPCCNLGGKNGDESWPNFEG